LWIRRFFKGFGPVLQHAEVIFTEKVGVFARKIEAKDQETFGL
jgi:hypothetical protein